MERQQPRERAAEILAEVSAILPILEMEQSVVQRSGEEYKREPLGTLEALGARLQAASAQLLGMAIRGAKFEVCRLARKLERALSESVVLSTVSLVGRALESESPCSLGSMPRPRRHAPAPRGSWTSWLRRSSAAEGRYGRPRSGRCLPRPSRSAAEAAHGHSAASAYDESHSAGPPEFAKPVITKSALAVTESDLLTILLTSGAERRTYRCVVPGGRDRV